MYKNDDPRRSLPQRGASRTLRTAKFAAYTGMMTALVTAATLIGVSGAGFYFNLGDSVILICAALLGPVPAMMAGGLGAFFADMAVYPATMLYTLVIKGIEGLVAGALLSIIARSTLRPLFKTLMSIGVILLSAMLMMLGYFIAQTFMYGTLTSALIALPMDAAQAAVSSAIASFALYAMKLIKLKTKL